jgi:uncharacterized protein (DUF2267 family)
MPWTYRHASEEYASILKDAKDRMNITSDNIAYTAIDGVLQTFRNRLTMAQALRFADVLPCVLRAIFVAHWIPRNPVAFASRVEMTKEVQSLRKDHNFAPDTAIEDVAYALRRHVHQNDLDAVLCAISPEAAAYWHVVVDDPAELEQRIL